MSRVLARLRAAGHDRGAVSPAIAILAVALLLVVGLVVDGGAKLNAVSQANDVAAQAAHAAAQQLDTQLALQGGQAVVDGAAAEAAGRQVLAAAGMTGSVVATGETVTVTATCVKPTSFLGLIGITTVEGTGHAQVRVATGEVP